MKLHYHIFTYANMLPYLNLQNSENVLFCIFAFRNVLFYKKKKNNNNTMYILQPDNKCRLDQFGLFMKAVLSLKLAFFSMINYFVT